MKKIFAFTLFSAALVCTGLQADTDAPAADEVTQVEAPAAEAPAAEEAAG